MNRLLKSMLITCITIGFSVNNLSAQEVWEELAEQLIDEEGGEVFQWENNFEELSELRENPIKRGRIWSSSEFVFSRSCYFGTLS